MIVIHIQRTETRNLETLRLPGLSRYRTETFARWSALVRLGSNQARNLAKGIRAKAVDNMCLFSAVEPRSFEILT